MKSIIKKIEYQIHNTAGNWGWCGGGQGDPMQVVRHAGEVPQATQEYDLALCGLHGGDALRG